MAMPLKSRLVRLRDSETVRFLELYGNERVLYDSTLEKYKDVVLRRAAAKRISEALEIPGFGPMEVMAKFKNMRSSFCQELKKIIESERLGTGIYVPTVFWFEQMNSFLRPYVHPRFSPPKLELQTNSNEEPDEEQSRCPQSSGSDAFYETKPCTPQITEQLEVTPRVAIKRKVTPKSSSSKIRKPSNDPEIDCFCGAMQNVPTQIQKNDSYDFFGKYVASMLRCIGPPTAMRLQEKMTTLVTTTMCPCPQTTPWSPPPSEQSVQSIIGNHSNMSEYPDSD